MRSLKINNWLVISLVVFAYSCTNNSVQINAYKNHIFSNLTSETQKESKEISFKLDSYKLKEEIIYTPNAIEKIDKLKLFKDSLNKAIFELDSINSNKINGIKNLLLYRFSTYKEGKWNWKLDTIKYTLNHCNPKDTMLISRTLNQFNLLNKNIYQNPNLLKTRILQLSQNIFNSWIERFDIVVFRCFGPVPKTILKSNNNILYQNEISYIYPNIFATGYDEPIHILKENSTEFIMENGVKKNFTNPITLKASSQKGVHKVKGVIMIKYQGELVPKLFEFRYIVE